MGSQARRDEHSPRASSAGEKNSELIKHRKNVSFAESVAEARGAGTSSAKFTACGTN